MARITDTLHEDRYTFLNISRFFLLRMRNVSGKFTETIKKPHFLYNFFFENRAVYEIKWKKYCTAGLATDDNTTHAHCMLDTEGYKHKLRTCNTLLLHYNNGCRSAPKCYVIRPLPVLSPLLLFYPCLYEAVQHHKHRFLSNWRTRRRIRWQEHARIRKFKKIVLLPMLYRPK
jgi:hypothetical protein